VLIDACTRLSTHVQAVDALREWLLLFVDFLDAKQGMAPALETLINGPAVLYGGTPGRLVSSIEALVSRAVEAGAISVDVAPLDLLWAIAGVANVRHSSYSKDAAIRMVELLLKGMLITR
jgi:hypothetical protein